MLIAFLLTSVSGLNSVPEVHSLGIGVPATHMKNSLHRSGCATLPQNPGGQIDGGASVPSVVLIVSASVLTEVVELSVLGELLSVVDGSSDVSVDAVVDGVRSATVVGAPVLTDVSSVVGTESVDVSSEVVGIDSVVLELSISVVEYSVVAVSSSRPMSPSVVTSEDSSAVVASVVVVAGPSVHPPSTMGTQL